MPAPLLFDISQPGDVPPRPACVSARKLSIPTAAGSDLTDVQPARRIDDREDERRDRDQCGDRDHDEYRGVLP
jgi:hypothetical protein